MVGVVQLGVLVHKGHSLVLLLPQIVSYLLPPIILFVTDIIYNFRASPTKWRETLPHEEKTFGVLIRKPSKDA